MRKTLFAGMIIGSLFLTGCAATVPPGQAKRRVPAPPPIVLKAKPRLVFISDAGIYYAPDAVADLYSCDNVWYYYYGGYWYYASSYQGPWIHLPSDRIPPGLRKIPPGHRKKIPPGQLKKGKGKGR